MSISVVMSVYNKGGYLNRSVSSVLNQKYNEFELICVDGGSTDNSLQVLESFSDPRLIIFPQDNLGISAAKNFGVSVSKYDFITFIDADDEWDSNYLCEINFLYKTYPYCSAFITGYYCEYGSYRNKVIVDGLGDHGVLKDYFARRLTGWGVHTSSVAIKKSAFMSVGGFPVLIGSHTLSNSYIIDCSGGVITECVNSFKQRVNWHEDKLNLVPKPQFQNKCCDFFVAVPGLDGEDQYLHDILAIEFSYAFSKRVLSRWYGNVLNQDTKQHNKLPIHPHLIALSNRLKKSGNFSNDVLKYLLYLDEAILRFIYSENRLAFSIILEMHSYFNRHWLAKVLRNSFLLKPTLISLDYLKRATKKIIRIFKTFLKPEVLPL
ncbi:MAG: glycosyltransferase family 2 protein [Acetobacterium woodii]|nr:glycosyltransferase family 2 protein [Acetobacterium woodii]MBI5677204.1 glycosyltransferase family 2 protein [Planctomycetota bacterium]